MSKIFLTSSQTIELDTMINDAEGIFPKDNIEKYILENKLFSKEIASYLAKFFVYKGLNLSANYQFFELFQNFETNPSVYLWSSYDALIRGDIELFNNLWLIYESIELKHYGHEHIREAIAIPEDPLFINVKTTVHDHQQRVLNTFILADSEKDKISEEELDNKLELFLNEFSFLLAFFRIQQVKFKRNITFDDLQVIEKLLEDQILHSFGKYWEMRILSTLSYWRLDLGAIYEATESIAALKALNGEAMNWYFESQIFHLESIISIKQNNLDNFKELLQSATFLASEYNFGYLYFDILITKAIYDKHSFLETTKEIEQKTNELNHKFIRAKLYALLGSYYISMKDWENAETELLRASKFLHDKFDLKLYYQIIADFSYVLLLSGQLHESLKSSQVLIEDEVPLLFQLRGYYLYGLASFLLKDNENGFKFVEEGIRVALTYKENISLPWFYELLGLMYISSSDWNTALKYLELTYKSYFEISQSKQAYRARLVTSYLMALDRNYGSAFTQIQNLLTEEISDTNLILESIWALQSIIIASGENIDFSSYREQWNQIIGQEMSEDMDIISKLFEIKNSIYFDNKTKLLDLNEISLSFKGDLTNIQTLELVNWIIIIAKKENVTLDNLNFLINNLRENFFQLKINFNLIKSYIKYIEEFNISNVNVETNSIQVSILIALIRILKKNLPFPDFL